MHPLEKQLHEESSRGLGDSYATRGRRRSNRMPYWARALRDSRLASRYDVLLFEPWPPSPLCDILPRLSVTSRMSPYTSSRGLSYGFFAGPSPVDLLVIAGILPEMSD